MSSSSSSPRPPANAADGPRTEAEWRARQAELERLLAERTAELERAKAELEANAARERESQSYFEKSFYSSPALMSIARATDGKLIAVNPAFLSISGFTREEVIGRTTLELGVWVRENQRDAFLHLLRAEEQIRDFEADFREKGGRVRSLLLNTDLIELGGLPCMLTVGIDITERRRHERMQAATYQISQAILAGGDLPALFSAVHRIIADLMPARNLYVALLNADRTELSFPYFADESIPPPPSRPPRNGMTEFVIDTREPLLATGDEILTKLQARGNYVPIGLRPAQWLGAPLLHEGRGIGVIALQDYTNPRAYTEADKRLLMFVADQTAAAIHHRQIEAAQREARAYFEKSFHASPALMSISRVRDNRIIEINPAFLRASGYAREEVLGRTTPELDIWISPAQREDFLRRMKQDGVVRNLQADFRAKDRAVTTLILNADLIELGGESCILTVGIDISERRRREQVQAATYAISQVVLAGGDLPALFAGVHRIIGELMPARNFYVALLNPERTELSFPYFVDQTMPHPGSRRPRNGVTEFVIDTGEPLLAQDAEIVARLKARGDYVPTGHPCAQWLGAPLMQDGRGIGVIALQDYENPNAYTEADKQLLMFVADQTAAAVHRQQVEAAQREARSHFEKSFHLNPAVMMISQPDDGRIVEINPEFTRVTGYTREESLGRTTGELDIWVDRTQRDAMFAQLQDTGRIRDVEVTLRHRAGRTSTLILNADIIELGGKPRLLTAGMNITERRRREQVQAATYQISQIVLAGGDLPALFAEVHRIIGSLMPAKNFYVALLGAEGKEISFPYFVDEFVPPPPPRPLSNGFTELVLETGRPAIVTAAELPALLGARGPYQPLDRPAAQRLGAPLVVRGRALGVIALQDYARPDAYGEEELRLLNFVAEQTAVAIQRRQAEAAMAHAQERYRSVFENAVEGLYVTSPEGYFVSANPALARMFGYESPAALVSAVNDIKQQVYVRRERRDEFFALIQRSDVVSDFESEVYRRDGSTFWISESVRVMRGADGTIDHFEGVAINITERREAARAMQLAKEAADAASRAKSYFLASVSHELRTPLNGILGYTQILRRDAGLTEKQREGVRVIHESADHLLALINDVLDLSKIEAGRIELHPADFDLPEFAGGVERVFASRAKEKSLLFESAVALDLPRWVRGDEQRLRQVVFNLVSNAVKFTRAGGVVFSVQRAGEAIRFSVSDTGPGISEEDLPKLFEPFTQVGNKASAAATGTGLGLAISRSLVERMGGRLHVESKPGWGSRFWFDVVLPEALAAVPAPAGPLRRIVGYDGPRRRVLVVDDNAANRAVMVDMLLPLGFELREAADGLAALAEADRFQPDLVLMDLRLPGEIDGLEATRRLRRGPRSGAMRIVAVSASAYDLDRSECLDAGCDEFLAKPFREEQLWAMVERVLKLAWQTADTEETRTPFPLVMQAPPPAEAAALYELAAKGDVVGIRARAQALIALDAKYAPFAQSVLDLAARFKMKAIRQFVARYMNP